MFEKIKARRLCGIISKELEAKGYFTWPVKDKEDIYNLGITLPDKVIRSRKEFGKYEDMLVEIRGKYSNANISFSRPVFSAGGVYASYASIKYGNKK
jgi:hypothetical protein